jgi:DNA-binding transcriptional regulator YhcF (GntR family)
MVLAVLDKLNTQRTASMPVYQHLAEQLIARIDAGKLASGDKLPTEHELAKKLGINRLTVRKSYQLLENRNLVERRCGVGTFVLSSKKDNPLPNNNDKTIYILLPHPLHITLQNGSSLFFRRIIYGASMENAGNIIQPLPVSRKLGNKLKHIDWDTIRRIQEGAKVFVLGMWFKDLFPFLVKRNVHGLFLNNQHDKTEYPQEYEKLINAGWNFITIDRLSAMEQAVEYLYGLGRRRIAVIKRYKDEPLHPFRQGMINGYERCGMEYDEKLYLELDPQVSFFKLENEICELWKKTRFDALVCGVHYLTKPVYDTLTGKLGLRLPEDVALMVFSDNPACLDFDVPVTAIDFPNVNLGREIAKIFNRKKASSGELVFQASIIERESTRKGAGAYVNHAFMPEISINKDITSIN